MTLVIGVSNVLGAFLSLTTAHFKRLKVFSIALIVHAIAMAGVVIGIYTETGIVAAISVSLYILSFAIGNGSTLFVYLSEILPSSGVGVTIACQWVASALIGIGVPPLSEAIGINTLFCACVVFIIIDVILLNVLGEETLDKTQAEIDAAFMGKKAPKAKKTAEIPKNKVQAQ